MAQQGNELTEPMVKWIEQELVRRKWRQADLGRRANVGADVLSRMFSREVAPNLQTLKGVARAFGMSLTELQLIAALELLHDSQEQGPGGPGLPQDARSTPAPYGGGSASQRPRATVVSESLREKADRGNLTVAEEWDRLAKSVAERWHRIIVKHRIPFGDVLDLLQAEEDFLRERAKGRGSAGAHLLAAADDVAQLRESISQLPEPR